MPLTALRSPQAAARWLQSWVQGTLRSDSRQVRPGDAFIAWPGHATDGRRFVEPALAAGAATCLVEAEGIEAFGFEDARVAALPGLKSAAGPIAHEFFGQPSAALDIVASTGTNGKTSTAWWMAQALTALGRRCGVVGTLGIGETPDAVVATGLTTPDPVALHAAFRRFADQGFAACAIEASSIGVEEHRLNGTAIDVALFTNFTQDHLDYHGSMAAYWAAKRRLFGWPGLRAAVLNVDDPAIAALVTELEGGPLALWTYAVQAPARLRALAPHYVDGGLAFEVEEAGAEGGPLGRVAVQSRLVGAYNVANLLAVIGGLRALGVPLAEAATVIPGLTPVPGRLQRVPAAAGEPELIVDYAHTPDALAQVLAALRPLAAERGGALWCVFGCGGNRDPGKRPQMAAIAERGADRVLLTSDNPRHEDPLAILAGLRAGLAAPDAVETVADRRAAIRAAVAAAGPRDVVLLAGKGHEDYQEVAGVRHPFSDLAEAAAALGARRENRS